MAHDPDRLRRAAFELANPRCPLPGVATAGQPGEEELEKLASAGYRTVLDLRDPGEPRGFDEPAAVRRAGMEYINIPVTPETVSEETFDRFREVMRDRSRRPMVVHCGTANRVGALLIAYLVLDEGLAPEDAVERAVDVGLRSRSLSDAALDYVGRHRRE